MIIRGEGINICAFLKAWFAKKWIHALQNERLDPNFSTSRAAFMGISRVTFAGWKRGKKRAKPGNPEEDKSLKLVSSDPKAQRQGLHFDFTCKFMRPHTHLGKSAILPDTLCNFWNFNILGKSFLFFFFFVEQPKCWVVWPDLNFQGHVDLKQKKKKKRKISSLLQVLNVHTSVHFSFAYVCSCSLCIHSLWLVASLAIGKIHFTVYCLHCIYLYDNKLYVIRMRYIWNVHTRL